MINLKFGKARVYSQEINKVVGGRRFQTFISIKVKIKELVLTMIENTNRKTLKGRRMGY
jgi:hypothetical protein